MTYADTSFLFSLYAQDANTPCASEMARMLDEDLVLTPHQRFELRNALRLSVFRGSMSMHECTRILDTLETDILIGSLVEVPMPWAEVFAEAEALSAAHTARLGIRAADLLHVASARALGARRFYTFDVRQKSIASKAGLRVRP